MDSLVAIEESLDNLEEVLGLLFKNNLSHTLSQLDPLQKAKLQVLLPYVINDLVFIYLKTRGINPKTHPVVGELDRIKQYFGKIKNVEDPEKRRFAVDQGAATRFIRHAIKESQAAQQDQVQRELRNGSHPRSADVKVAQEVGSSVSAAALAKIQARESEDHEESSSEESELQVISDSPKPAEPGEPVDAGAGPVKGKEKETSPSKKRRRGMDPWGDNHG